MFFEWLDSLESWTHLEKERGQSLRLVVFLTQERFVPRILFIFLHWLFQVYKLDGCD